MKVVFCAWEAVWRRILTINLLNRHKQCLTDAIFARMKNQLIMCLAEKQVSTGGYKFLFGVV